MTGASSAARFSSLDGLRGVAALAIVIRHAPAYFGGNPFATSYLAVDFFFLLSGFVLAHAYETKFAAGLGWAGFMKQRLLRLYPIYALALVLALGGVIAGTLAGVRLTWALPDLLTATAFNAFFLPGPAIEGRALFPTNVPAWSLFYELVINLAWALVAPRLTTRVLVGVVACFGAVLIATGVFYGSLDLGWNWPTFLGGLARVAWSFPAGVLIYRLTRNASPIPVPAIIPALLLLLAFVPAPGWYDTLAVMLIFPAILLLGSRVRPGREADFMTFLGMISYPIYALHYTVVTSATAILQKVLHVRVEAFAPWAGIALLAVLIAGSWAVEKFYDRPVRDWLKRRRSERPAMSDRSSRLRA